MANENNLKSILSAAICRQLEDYLTVCALANTIILLTMGVLMGLLSNNLTHSSLGAMAAVSLTQRAQFGLGFSSIFLLVISRVLLWPLLWLVNQLKRYTIRLAQGNSQGREVRDRQLVPGDDV